MADANIDPVIEPVPDPKDDLIPRAEAKKAFEARDKAKKEADTLRAKLADIEQAEADRAAKAEEDRLKKSGEWEAVKQTLVQKHTAEIEAERTARKTLESSYTKEKIESAFLAAKDWFGGSTAKTILTGPMANKVLSEYVSYEDVELGGRTARQIVVRDTTGSIIVDGNGNPAKFTEAIGELINQLPDKDDILRGSGKTGSGSSGGSTHAANKADVTELTKRAQAGDKDAIAALRSRRAAGNALQMGSAFTR